MNTNFYVTKRRLLVLCTLLLMWAIPKLNAQVTFNGTLESDPISVCDGSNQPLQVDFTVGQATNNPISVSVVLADGIEYDGGLSIVSSNPAGAYVIEEDNIANPANPTFSIRHADNSPIGIGENVVFTFDRKANCTAYQNACGVS